MTTPAVTPQPQVAPQQAAEATVPMQFKDGSQSMVPQSKVVDAMYDGGELLHPMKFPDGSQAMVAHSKLSGAMQDGGQRLDTKPIKAASWQDYIGTVFGALDPANSPGMETGIKNAGQDVSEGLTAATSGQPIKGAAQVAGAVADTTLPAAVPGSMGIQSSRWLTQQAAEKAALAAEPIGGKGLIKLAMDNYMKGEISGEAGEAARAKEFADATYKAAAQARDAGNNFRARAYDTLGMLARGKAKVAGATAEAMGTSKLAATAAMAYGAYESIAGAHDAYLMLKSLIPGSSSEEER
jgi:hypothetical protein